MNMITASEWGWRKVSQSNLNIWRSSGYLLLFLFDPIHIDTYTNRKIDVDYCTTAPLAIYAAVVGWWVALITKQ